jgi:hypothetical protein
MMDDKHKCHCCHCCDCHGDCKCGCKCDCHKEGAKKDWWKEGKITKEHLMEKKKFLEEKLKKIDKMIKEMK